MTMMAQIDDFNAALLQSIDEGISALLGQEVLDSIYLNLRNKRSINRDEIPDHTPILVVVLEKYFGPSAQTIGRGIARRLYSKLGVNFVVMEGFQLADYINVVRERYADASSKAVRTQ